MLFLTAFWRISDRSDDFLVLRWDDNPVPAQMYRFIASPGGVIRSQGPDQKMMRITNLDEGTTYAYSLFYQNRRDGTWYLLIEDMTTTSKSNIRVE